MMKFRDHKQDIVEAFSKVKRKHLEYDRRLEEHSDKSNQIEDVVKLLHEKLQIESKPRIVIKESDTVKMVGKKR